MNRRHFLALAAGTPFAAKAGRVVLNDYVSGGLHDLTAAMQAGPVELLDETYTIGPTYFPTGAHVKCLLGQAKIRYFGDRPAFQPLNQDAPTVRVAMENFDLICMDKASAYQHGFFLPACRMFTMNLIQIQDFGGCGVYACGKRTVNGLVDPSDTTRIKMTEVRSIRCGTGFRFSGTVGLPRYKGGTANMNQLDHCIASDCAGNGYEIIQGSASRLSGCVSVQCKGDGFYINWYGNTLVAPVFENNGGAGVRFGGSDECHDNYVLGWHDGGGHDVQFANPTKQFITRAP